MPDIVIARDKREAFAQGRPQVGGAQAWLGVICSGKERRPQPGTGAEAIDVSD